MTPLAADAIAACYASAKAALVTVGLLRLARVPPIPTLALSSLLAAALLPACLATPPSFSLAIRLLARAGVYAGLFALFGRSLRPGHEPIVTQLARRIDPVFTTKRLAYTRGVTRLWTAYFAAQFLATCLIPLAPAGPWTWLIAVSDLPLAAALLALELAFRHFHFLGQPHGSARATLASLLAPGNPHPP